MRVAFIDQTGNDAGGAQESLALLLRHLPASVEPVAMFFNDGPFAERIRAEGIETVVVPLQLRRLTRERVHLNSLIALPGTVRAVAAALTRARVRVAHTNTVKAHVIGGSAARLAGIPCVAHVRDILEGFGRRAVRAAIETCSGERIAISHAVAACFGLPRTTVVENPLDLSLYAPSANGGAARRALGIADDGVPLVGLVGRINRWKGQDRFLRAIAAARKTAPLRAAIVGSPRFRDADFLPELRALARALDLEGVVTFHDWVADPRTVYDALDVNVNASTREPFGRTVIEAAAAGVPTVCFDDSGVAESMLPAGIGIVAPAGDERALSAGILRYVASERVRREAGDAARAWSARFDAGRHARRVTGILTRAAAGGRFAPEAEAPSALYAEVR